MRAQHAGAEVVADASRIAVVDRAPTVPGTEHGLDREFELLHHVDREIPAGLVADHAEEQGADFLQVRGVERIVSRGHSAPKAGWFDQAEDEFVVLLSGSAGLEFDDGSRFELRPGDWLDIPARRRHRVAWTDADEATVWLAVHYQRE